MIRRIQPRAKTRSIVRSVRGYEAHYGETMLGVYPTQESAEASIHEALEADKTKHKGSGMPWC